jgi:glycosyltransferase involved in cell wall biosynthesis
MTTVAVSLEQRYCRTPDGQIWGAKDGYKFWGRYLEVFDAVKVLARIQEAVAVPNGWQRADGEGVTFVGVPYYIGPWEYLTQARVVRQAVRDAIGPRDAVIMRVGSQIAAILYPILRKSGRPYGVEVIADPHNVFSQGSKHPYRHFFRWKFCSQLRRQCAHAAAVAYVTERALQRRYPPAPQAFSTHYSSVELPGSAFVESPRLMNGRRNIITIVTVGSLEALVKGTDVLIKAVSLCRRQGMHIQLNVIGEGRCRPTLENMVHHSSRGHVQFLGQLSRADVFVELDKADLFVLPSRGEGLPSAMIEAMARGVPCIGSSVGGIPELIQPENLVPPGDSESLAAKLQDVLSSPDRLAVMSAWNIEKAKEYQEDALSGRRVEFYRYVRERIEAACGL